MSAPDTPRVHFLSDYGLDDEFVGVVHAVLHRFAPGLEVIDLTHLVRPFDVRAGGQALWRAAPHLGPGVVLAVVDPGVGTDRRCVALEVASVTGPRFWVGPDNGLLLPAAESLGPLAGAVSLGRHEGVGLGTSTFDGRDVLAPAAAALALGGSLSTLDPASHPVELSTDRLVRPAPLVLDERVIDGRLVLRAEVSWVDRFGNVQLSAGAAPLARTPNGLEIATGSTTRPARRVTAFGELQPDEVGVLPDANGRLALAADRGRADHLLGVAEGDVVELSWQVGGAVLPVRSEE